MHLTRRALIKWSLLTCVCGAQSFWWGFLVTKGAVTAMLLGMATLVLMFALIESHPYYQARRAGNAPLAKALDVGIRIRWVYALLYPLFYAIAYVLPSIEKLAPFVLLGDVFVGRVATEISHTLTGVRLNMESVKNIFTTGLDFQLTVYLTTLITGLLHTLILALICAVMYGLLKLRNRCCNT